MCNDPSEQANTPDINVDVKNIPCAPLSAATTFHSPVPSRRHFFHVLGGGMVLALAGPWRAQARAKKVALGLAQAEALKEVGKAASLTIKGLPILLVRDTETTVRAFNSTCTHKKCKVYWKEDTQKVQCKCHKSAFDLEGNVLGGPATKPLQMYPADLQTDRIVITLPDEEAP